MRSARTRPDCFARAARARSSLAHLHMFHIDGEDARSRPARPRSRLLPSRLYPSDAHRGRLGAPPLPPAPACLPHPCLAVGGARRRTGSEAHHVRSSPSSAAPPGEGGGPAICAQQKRGRVQPPRLPVPAPQESWGSAPLPSVVPRPRIAPPQRTSARLPTLTHSRHICYRRRAADGKISPNARWHGKTQVRTLC